MLQVTVCGVVMLKPPTRREEQRVWRQFIKTGQTVHSKFALSLPYLINRCEEEKVPYILTAIPGKGYTLAKALHPTNSKELML